MDVLILGSGAVGLGLGSCLLKSGVQTTLLAGNETVARLKTEGLKRTGIFGDFLAKPDRFTAYSDLSELQSGAFDYVLVCTKSNQTQTVAENLSAHRHLLKDQAKIVHFQNGWGNAEKFQACFDRETIYSGRVITGFTRSEPNCVEVTVHAEAVHVGSLFGMPTAPIAPLCEAIDKGDLPCQPWPDIERDLWAKMLYNCALNPLGAILDVPYGKLAHYPSTRELMDHIIQEIFMVMNLHGFQTYWDNAEHYRDVFYHQLIPATAEHRSSTLQDLKAGKKTEIDALTGQIIALGRACHREVPYNQSLYNLIHFIEKDSF